MKGILLAGGHGTRLWPLTNSVSKQLLPIYNKPMIYYPLSVLLEADIRDILIISTPHDLPDIKKLLGDGSNLGIRLSYIQQDYPAGIAQSFILGEEFIGTDSVCLVLGDNIFYGNELISNINQAKSLSEGGCIFAYHVSDPGRYGVVEFDQNFKAISIEEKPKTPKSSWAVSGLYFYDNQVCRLAKTLKPSLRGELEITDLSNIYLQMGKLKVEKISKGVAWLDTGTCDSLLLASHFVQTIELRQGLKIACIEEIALNKGFISKDKLADILKNYPDNEYISYLRKLL